MPAVGNRRTHTPVPLAGGLSGEPRLTGLCEGARGARTSLCADNAPELSASTSENTAVSTGIRSQISRVDQALPPTCPDPRGVHDALERSERALSRALIAAARRFDARPSRKAGFPPPSPGAPPVAEGPLVSIMHPPTGARGLRGPRAAGRSFSDRRLPAPHTGASGAPGKAAISTPCTRRQPLNSLRRPGGEEGGRRNKRTGDLQPVSLRALDEDICSLPGGRQSCHKTHDCARGWR